MRVEVLRGVGRNPSKGASVNMFSSDSRISMEVVVNSRPIKKYQHNEQVWVEGREGSKYSLRFTNNTDNRVLAVASVDGKSIMDGSPASHDSGGYVLGPFQTATIPGWFRDNDHAAQFEFVNVSQSYAAQTGQAENIGVIGCAFFFERRKQVFRGQPRISSLSTFGGGGMLKGMGGIGTGYGDEVEHRVSKTTFDRDSKTPFLVLTIRYADRAGLLQAGVDLKPRPAIAVPASADPFPAGKVIPGCPAPEGWRPKK